jgi:hypothetical protein
VPALSAPLTLRRYHGILQLPDGRSSSRIPHIAPSSPTRCSRSQLLPRRNQDLHALDHPRLAADQELSRSCASRGSDPRHGEMPAATWPPLAATCCTSSPVESLREMYAPSSFCCQHLFDSQKPATHPRGMRRDMPRDPHLNSPASEQPPLLPHTKPFGNFLGRNTKPRHTKTQPPPQEGYQVYKRIYLVYKRIYLMSLLFCV